MIEHKFGVEVETLFTREKAARALGKHWGTENTVYHFGGTYDKWTVEDPVGRVWAAMSDSSVCHAPGDPDRSYTVQSAEIVTPLLNWGDIEMFQEAIRALRAAGAYTNRTCGVHVHVDAHLTPQTARSLVNLTNAQEDMLTHSLAISPERRYHWCKPVDPDFLEKLNKRKPDTMEAFERLWYRENGGYDRHSHYDHSRYHLLNLHSYFQGKGVEFRAFDGTLHAGKLKAYIQLSCAMVGKAEASKTSNPTRPETDNPAYTFRCWLLRLGLIGEQYKTARTHLLANMPGNSAWRHAPTTRRTQPGTEVEG